MKKQIGFKLKSIREERNLSKYYIAKYGNIRINQVTAVENGCTGYTVDALIGYLSALQLTFKITVQDD